MFLSTGTWEQKFPKEMTHYRNFRINEKTNVRVPMMTNKGNYLAAADHELECDILQVGDLRIQIQNFSNMSEKLQAFSKKTPSYKNMHTDL